MISNPMVIGVFIFCITGFAAIPAAESVHCTISGGAVASNAYNILASIPEKGFEASSDGIHKIIQQRHILEQSNNLRQRQMALILADVVGIVIIREIQNYEKQGTNAEQALFSKVPIASKQVIIDVWRANEINEKSAIRACSIVNSDLVKFAFQDNCEEEVLNGSMIYKASGATLSRIRELQSSARSYSGLNRAPSADELLMHTLVTVQNFRDLNVIVDLFWKGDFPRDRTQFQNAIESILMQTTVRRLDDGMKASYIKVLSTYGRYRVPDSDAYQLKIALLLGHFMDDKSTLPETAKRIFKEYGDSDK
jgi:hypothetical protein